MAIAQICCLNSRGNLWKGKVGAAIVRAYWLACLEANQSDGGRTDDSAVEIWAVQGRRGKLGKRGSVVNMYRRDRLTCPVECEAAPRLVVKPYLGRTASRSIVSATLYK